MIVGITLHPFITVLFLRRIIVDEKLESIFKAIKKTQQRSKDVVSNGKLDRCFIHTVVICRFFRDTLLK